MDDRELLELAAKAYGHQVKGWVGDRLSFFDPILDSAEYEWNPLTDDGDALRLAVKLKIEVAPQAFAMSRVDVRTHGGKWMWEQYSIHGDDAQKATRRAIVRAAADIGRSIQDALQGRAG